MRLRIFEHSSDTPKFNIHEYRNYNIIEAHTNRLSIKRQIFIVIDHLILMSEN